MAGLQRSEISFRRQGSSGLVWDDKFLSGELKQIEPNDDTRKQSSEQPKTVQRSRSLGSGAAAGGHSYRTVKVEPTLDPPSPKVSGCGFCGMFGKPVPDESERRKRGSGSTRTRTRTRTS